MENFENQNIEQDSYKTGSTKPPKSRRGLIAVLLVAVILLCGITQALGIINISLFQQLQEQQDPSMAAISDLTVSEPANTQASGNDGAACLGIRGAAVDDFYQIYYRYPKGIYITEVDDGCDSAAKGIQAGDILISLDGTAVADEQTLTQLLGGYRAGDTISAVIYRDGSRYTVSVILKASK